MRLPRVDNKIVDASTPTVKILSRQAGTFRDKGCVLFQADLDLPNTGDGAPVP